MNLAIRLMASGDVDQVFKLERRSEGAAHWSRQIYEELPEASSNPQLRKLALVAELGSSFVGFVIGRVVLDEAELENIVVDAALRRQGIALALLRAFADAVKATGARHLRLEVREGNASARAFYEHAGFFLEARRAAYYRDPQEAALVLRLNLEEDDIAQSHDPHPSQ